MKPKKLKERLDEMDAALASLTIRVDEIARYAVRMDENIEVLEQRVQRLREPHADTSVTRSDLALDLLRRQAVELRRGTRSRILSGRGSNAG